MTSPAVVLSIAGTDSGGSAGLAADLTTFAALGAHGCCAVTAVTAQSTTGVDSIVPLAATDVQAQMVAVLEDLPVAAAKAGMLGSAQTAYVVADLVAGSVPLVIDPVLVATSGATLGDDALVAAYRDVLLPKCTVVTPNLDEAARLTGLDPQRPAIEIARALHEIAPAVVLTGGDPSAQVCRDVVIDTIGRLTVLEHPTVPSGNDHGTGCTFSAALAVHLAHGLDLQSAVRLAQAFVAAALTISASWELGRGRGPVAHVFNHPH
ncbi:bifunctional hydroxymethylpyrimidine kinase/phosphomethylpyrimidine kinase [Aeromicrobium sp.]|uniref:bifunctional hydroxymethylpyrimidine kinase/phosphomethylpyrimidine kinase n=1 Tax=Aeromicrobium sp. TaxID=1871063 RepID=UPI0030BA3425